MEVLVHYTVDYTEYHGYSAIYHQHIILGDAWIVMIR